MNNEVVQFYNRSIGSTVAIKFKTCQSVLNFNFAGLRLETNDRLRIIQDKDSVYC